MAYPNTVGLAFDFQPRLLIQFRHIRNSKDDCVGLRIEIRFPQKDVLEQCRHMGPEAPHTSCIRWTQVQGLSLGISPGIRVNA